MANAAWNGWKWQTRRVIKPQPYPYAGGWRQDVGTRKTSETRWMPKHGPYPLMAKCCPYGQPGDHLWVKEPWRETGSVQRPDGSQPPPEIVAGHVIYAADHPEEGPWRSSRFMPRLASRMTLLIRDIRVERVRDITEEDARAEGILEPAPAHGNWCDPHKGREGHWSYRKPFADLWDTINSKRGFGWDANPWCWVIEFRKVEDTCSNQTKE